MNKGERTEILRDAMAPICEITPDWIKRDGRSRHFSSLLRIKLLKQRCFFVALAVSRFSGSDVFGISGSVGWAKDPEFDMSTAVNYRPISGTSETLARATNAPEWKLKEFQVGLEHLKRRVGVFAPLEINSENYLLLCDDVKQVGLPFLRIAAQRGLGIDSPF